MHKYILRRVLYAFPTLIGVTMIIFLAMRVLPGDVTAVMFGEEGSQRLTPAEVRAVEEDLGLHDPLAQQYGEWLLDIAKLDFGRSFWRGDTVREMFVRRGPISIQIAIMAIILSWMVGVPVGIISALNQDTFIDYALRVFTIAFVAIPAFWLATLIVLVLLLNFGWKSPHGIFFPWQDPIENLKTVWGPVLVLGLGVAGLTARMTRSSLLEVIHEDYVRTARAKGLAERIVIIRHALRNALLPVITLSGVTFGFLLGGSVVTEFAFDVPGLGNALVVAFDERDYIVMQNLVLMYATTFVVINLIVDLCYAWLDPRIRLE